MAGYTSSNVGTTQLSHHGRDIPPTCPERSGRVFAGFHARRTIRNLHDSKSAQRTEIHLQKYTSMLTSHMTPECHTRVPYLFCPFCCLRAFLASGDHSRYRVPHIRHLLRTNRGGLAGITRHQAPKDLAKIRLVFSWFCKLLFSQSIWIDAVANCPRGWGGPLSSRYDCQSETRRAKF